MTATPKWTICARLPALLAHPQPRKFGDRHLERWTPCATLGNWSLSSVMRTLPICAAVASGWPLPEPVQCCLRDLAPAVVDRERVAAVRELDEVGDGR
jgi:hypothetical protein